MNMANRGFGLLMMVVTLTALSSLALTSLLLQTQSLQAQQQLLWLQLQHQQQDNLKSAKERFEQQRNTSD